jgi:enamine deaminase RidA (YjgF/YER057c/UK114 family)
MSFKFINPESLGTPKGYANGVLAEHPGRLLFIAGQVGWDEQQNFVSADLVEQFDRALANVITVVRDAGGDESRIARMILYVTDRDEYRARLKEIGERYRAHMGKHFPAMVLLGVNGLLEPEACIEIEATAILES